MPISKANMALYPGGSIRSPEWLAIRERIRLRAHDLCEECGIPNGMVGYRDAADKFVVITDMPNIWKGVSAERFGGPPKNKVFMVVCTVAHLDGKLTDHSDANFKFLCQRCHNRLDAKDRAVNAARTRKAKLAVAMGGE